jgi:hypothetical protein
VERRVIFTTAKPVWRNTRGFLAIGELEVKAVYETQEIFLMDFQQNDTSFDGIACHLKGNR